MDCFDIQALQELAISTLRQEQQERIWRNHKIGGSDALKIDLLLMGTNLLKHIKPKAHERLAFALVERTLHHPDGLIDENEQERIEAEQERSEIECDLITMARRLCLMVERPEPDWLKAQSPVQAYDGVGGSDTPDNRTSDWRQRVRDAATQWCRERQGNDQPKPTKTAVAAEMAVWCRNNEIETDTGINPDAEYIRRHILNRWNYP